VPPFGAGGVPLHAVAQRLGHKDSMVTSTIYAQVTSKQEDRAAAEYESWLEGPGGEDKEAQADDGR